MTARGERNHSRALPLLATVITVVAVSIAAYSGQTPSLLSSHGIDKVFHATMGAALTFALTRALRGRAELSALLVLLPLGLDEYLQRYSGARSSDWADLAADVVGALVAVAVHRAWRSWR